MGLDDAQDAATSPMIPFIGEANLSVALIVSLFVGMLILKLVDPLSASVAQQLSEFVAQATGFDPQTGDTTSPNTGAFA